MSINKDDVEDVDISIINAPEIDDSTNGGGGGGGMSERNEQKDVSMEEEKDNGEKKEDQIKEKQDMDKKGEREDMNKSGDKNYKEEEDEEDRSSGESRRADSFVMVPDANKQDHQTYHTLQSIRLVVGQCLFNAISCLCDSFNMCILKTHTHKYRHLYTSCLHPCTQKIHLHPHTHQLPHKFTRTHFFSPISTSPHQLQQPQLPPTHRLGGCVRHRRALQNTTDASDRAHLPHDQGHVRPRTLHQLLTHSCSQTHTTHLQVSSIHFK